MNYPYKIISRTDILPISLNYAKEYLHIDIANTAHDTAVTSMLKAARDNFESATSYYLTNTTMETYRCDFGVGYIQIRRNPNLSLNTISYYDSDDVLQVIDSANYFIKKMNSYDFIGFKQSFNTPDLSEDVAWPIIISFTVGYTNTEGAIPDDAKEALLAHVAKMFENRGDAYEFDRSLSRSLIPRTTRLIINKYKVESL